MSVKFDSFSCFSLPRWANAKSSHVKTALIPGLLQETKCCETLPHYLVQKHISRNSALAAFLPLAQKDAREYINEDAYRFSLGTIIVIKIKTKIVRTKTTSLSAKGETLTCVSVKGEQK